MKDKVKEVSYREYDGLKEQVITITTTDKNTAMEILNYISK